VGRAAVRGGSRDGLRRWPQHRDPASDECWSPGWVVDWARGVLGGIDLDPASCEEAQRTVRAARWCGVEDDGLALPWAGRVWLNPPWGAGQKPLWVEKLLSERDVTAWAALMSLDLTSAAVRRLACAAEVVMVPTTKLRYARPEGSFTVGWFASAVFFGGPGLDADAARVPPREFGGRWVEASFSDVSLQQRLWAPGRGAAVPAGRRGEGGS